MMETKFTKHYADGVAAAKAGTPANPWEGPQWAGPRGQGKAAAFAAGVASVLGAAQPADRPKGRGKGARNGKR